jgi:response regulator RpfG family c-di-GMP phosphodiesterase
MTLAMAIAEIKRCSGTQFDPAVVDAVVSSADAGELQLLPRSGSHMVVSQV